MRFMRPLPRALGTFLLGLMGLAALPAQAQLRVDISGGLSAPMPIAIPVMPTPQPVPTPAGTTAALGQQVSQVISNDLKGRSEEHTSELQSLMRISYAVFCLKKKNTTSTT